MKNLKTLLLILLFAPTLLFGQLIEHQLPAKKPYPYPMAYLEHIPKWVTACTKKPPILIFLHGFGEGYEKCPLSILTNTGLPKLIKNNTLPVDSFLILCPQGPKSISIPALEAFIKYAKTTYLDADTTRIYLTGLSGGAITGLNYIKSHKDITASVFIAGSSTSKSVCSTYLPTTPLWLFHGDADSQVPTTGSTNLYKGVKLCNDSSIKISIYSAVDHNSWDRTYDLSGMNKSKTEHNFGTSYKKDIRTIDLYNIDMYNWLLSYK